MAGEEPERTHPEGQWGAGRDGLLQYIVGHLQKTGYGRALIEAKSMAEARAVLDEAGIDRTDLEDYAHYNRKNAKAFQNNPVEPYESDLATHYIRERILKTCKHDIALEDQPHNPFNVRRWAESILHAAGEDGLAHEKLFKKIMYNTILREIGAKLSPGGDEEDNLVNGALGIRKILDEGESIPQVVKNNSDRQEQWRTIRMANTQQPIDDAKLFEEVLEYDGLVAYARKVIANQMKGHMRKESHRPAFTNAHLR